MVKRLGLARAPEDPLGRAVAGAGWEPIPMFLTAQVPTLAPPPLDRPDAAILLSPAGVRAVALPEGLPVLVTGEGSARALSGRQVLVSPEPRAEGLWTLLKAQFPSGGDFLLVRGERSRGFLEEVAEGTSWRLHPWITHAERPLEPLPDLPQLEGVLALSPLQAEVMGPMAGQLLRFAWGERAAAAFSGTGHPAHAICEPRVEALGRMLAPYA